MKRTIVKINEDKCTGCGICVNKCHEGALQLINGKAVMIGEVYCDGLGACIGDCPFDAITLEEREAEAYNETTVMQQLIHKGNDVIIAHLKHLKDHQQHDLFNEGIAFLKEHNIAIDMNVFAEEKKPVFTGCPGSKAMVFDTVNENVNTNETSQLQQWPIQLHLLSPNAQYLNNADLLLAADCVAFSLGNFHSAYLRGKRLAIACPKLDSNQNVYLDKLVAMINQAHINILTVMIMEVPCCGGLLQLAKKALELADRKIPIKVVMVGIQGGILKEEWI